MVIRTLFICLALVLANPSAYAEPAPQYQLEIILFEYTNDANARTEDWPQYPGSPIHDNPLTIITDPESSSMQTQQPTAVTQGFRKLDSKDLLLSKEAAAIKRSSRRKLLLHLGWVQTMYDVNQARPIELHLGAEYLTRIPANTDTDSAMSDVTWQEDGNNNSAPISTEPATTPAEITQPGPYTDTETFENNAIPGAASEPVEPPMAETVVRQLEGHIMISISRYLHIWTDLVFHRPDSLPAMLDDQQQYTPLVHYRFKDHRRMRSRELHYIDNPVFGILFYAIPYEAEKSNKDNASLR